jgi:hypothetical protein
MLPQLHADDGVRVPYEPEQALTCLGGNMRALGDPGRAHSRSSRVACKFVWVDR